MTLEEKERRYKWLRSQQRFHAKRSGRWHLNQMRWYRRQANMVFTLTDIIARTIRERTPQLMVNIVATNALLKRLSERRLAI